MKHKVAIEPNLTPIRDYLVDKGFDVESINLGEETSRYTDKFDAFVVTGLNSNFLGINNTSSKAIVVEASGMTPDEVYRELESKFH